MNSETDHFLKLSAIHPFSPAETRILNIFIDKPGLTNKEIAYHLGISPQTVKNYHDTYHDSRMPQVSKFRLRPDVWERIFDLYIDTIAGITDKEKLTKFINNFFTPTEKIMFAKRLAACVMLAKNQDYRTIERILRISPMTISRMSFHLKYEGEGLNPVIENILKKDAVKVLWEELKDLLDVPTKGKDWSELAKRKSVRRRKIESLKTK